MQPRRPLRLARGGASSREEPWRVPAAIAAALSGFAALVFEVGVDAADRTDHRPHDLRVCAHGRIFHRRHCAGIGFGLRLARHRFAPRNVAVRHAGTLRCGARWSPRGSPLCSFLSSSRATSTPASAFGPLLVREALVLGVTLIAASAGFGATFTLALALGGCRHRPASPRQRPRVYALNTTGAVAGALAGGFVLLPRFGIETTFLVTSRLLIATAAALAAACALQRRALRWSASMMAAGVACVLLGTFALPGWNRDVLTSGFYKYARGVNVEDIEISARAGQLEYYKEGAAGTVSVKSLAGTRSLAIDGKVDASNGGDMLTQRLLGVLPMLAHHDPRAALVIGLGSGVTAAAARATQAVGNSISSRFLRRSSKRLRYSSGKTAESSEVPARRLLARRRPHAPAADNQTIRRHRVGAIEPVDGGRRGAVHARIFRGRAAPADGGRGLLPMDAHV